MRSSRAPPTLLSFVALVLSTSHIAQANPYPRDLLNNRSAHNASLELRQNACPVENQCGWEGKYCCEAGQACYISNGQALCGAGGGSQAVATQAAAGGGGNGNWQYYTTTYIETDLRTITSTYSVLSTPAAGGVGTPTVTGGVVTATANPCAPGQEFCGGYLCCATNQVCVVYGQCGDKNSAFIRPTSNTIQTLTSTASASTTQPVETPVTSDGSAIGVEPQSSGLSGGAIAGIVIGVLLGLLLLFLLLACLCCRGILGAFGGGKKKRTEETYIATHHSSHHGSHAPPKRRWFGMVGPAGPSRPPKEKKSGIGAGGVLGILAGLAVILGLKRKHDRHNENASSYGSETSYSYTDYTTTSASSASSDDRRTRGTRHSRR